MSLTVSDLRVVLRAAAILREHGFPQVAEMARALRDRYVRERGVRQYLYEMLGNRANWPAGQFQMFRTGQPVVLPKEVRRMSLADYLCQVDELPDQVVFDENGRKMAWEI